MFLLCFLLTYTLFHSLTDTFVPNALTAAAYLGLFALATVLICFKQKRFPPKALLPGILCLALCLSFVLHSDSNLHPVLFLLLIPLSGFYCIALTGANLHSFGSIYVLLDLIWCELLLPFRHLFAPLHAASDRRKARRAAKGTAKERKTWVPVAVGLLVAVPVLLVVIPLLIHADAAFESFAGTAYAAVQKALAAFGDFLAKYLPFDGFALILALLFSPYIYAVMFSFANGTAKKENIDTSGKYRRLQRAPLPFFTALLGVVSAVYVIYLLSQTAYFFSAFSGHLPSGAAITVTEYARRGFFEMAKIAGVNFVLIALSVGLCKRNGNRLPKALKGLNAFLCVFTMLLCAISVSKILLYIRTFGLTEKRIYVFAADLVLFFTFGAILLRLFSEKFPYMKVILAAGFLCAATLGLLGVNHTIAQHNTNLLLSTGEERSFESLWVDCEDAGLPYLKAIAASDTTNAKQAQQRLDEVYLYDSYRRDEPFYNFEQARFIREIRENGIGEDCFTLLVNFDLPESVYALDYSIGLKGKTLFGGGMEHADKSPLDVTERIEILRRDLPENTDLQDLELQISLRFTPKETGKSVPVKSLSSDLLKGYVFGEYMNLLIVKEEDGTYVMQ